MLPNQWVMRRVVLFIRKGRGLPSYKTLKKSWSMSCSARKIDLSMQVRKWRRLRCRYTMLAVFLVTKHRQMTSRLSSNSNSNSSQLKNFSRWQQKQSAVAGYCSEREVQRWIHKLINRSSKGTSLTRVNRVNRRLLCQVCWPISWSRWGVPIEHRTGSTWPSCWGSQCRCKVNWIPTLNNSVPWCPCHPGINSSVRRHRSSRSWLSTLKGYWLGARTKQRGWKSREVISSLSNRVFYNPLKWKQSRFLYNLEWKTVKCKLYSFQQNISRSLYILTIIYSL